MSGFERSAPIPGSQGPRRSQMVRYNNAPPPLTPWRAEVLEAQKQIEAAKKERTSRSRSRSKSRRRAKGGASVSASSSAADPAARQKAAASSLAPETGVVLRQARERGEGWYAAVARAAESWESVPTGRKRPGGKAGKPDELTLEGHKQLRPDKKGKGKDKPDREEIDSERPKREDKEDRLRQEELRAEKEKEEQKAREEYEARAEERRLKAEEEKRRAEEERAKMEVLKRKRQEKLKGAFAIGQEEEEDEKREADLVRKAAEKKKNNQSEMTDTNRTPVATGAVALQVAAPSTALMPRSTPRQVDPELSEKLRFEPGLDPAEAFMRLQERKRKGRRAEFGGPPRGCSPWRDGRRGISWQKDGEPPQ